MATITGNITITTSFRQVTASGFGSNQISTGGNQSYSAPFSTGGTAGAANQADLKHTKVYTLSGSATTIDLTNLTDDSGATISFARVRSLTVRNRSTTDGQTVTVTAGASNGWTAPGGSGWSQYAFPATSACAGFYAFTAPNTTGAVVDSTHKTLKLDPGANTITVDVEIVGCSA